MTNAPAEIVERNAQADKALAPFLDGRPFDRAAYESEMMFLAQQHAMSAFDLGRRLIVYKEKAGHGNFARFIAEQLHFSPQYCRQLMAFARTVVAIGTTARGAIDLKKLAAMDQRKVLLLGEVAAEHQEELADTGTIGGRQLDEFDAMSRHELRDEIRRLQGRIEEGREQLRKRADKVSHLDAQLRELREAKPGAVTRRADATFNEIAAACHKFRETLPQGQNLTHDDAAALHRLREGALRLVDSLTEFIAEVYPEAHDEMPAAAHQAVRRRLDPERPAAAVADIRP